MITGLVGAPVGDPPAGSTLIASLAPGTRRFEGAGATGTSADRRASVRTDRARSTKTLRGYVFYK
jgi:hypothetical protein